MDLEEHKAHGEPGEDSARGGRQCLGNEVPPSTAECLDQTQKVQGIIGDSDQGASRPRENELKTERLEAGGLFRKFLQGSRGRQAFVFPFPSTKCSWGQEGAALSGCPLGCGHLSCQTAPFPSPSPLLLSLLSPLECPCRKVCQGRRGGKYWHQSLVAGYVERDFRVCRFICRSGL